MIIVEEYGAGSGLGAFRGGDGGTVEEVNVEPAVVVVVEKGDAGTGSFDDGGFFGRAGAMMEFVKAGMMSDVEEDDGSVVDKAACSDGAGVGILDGGMNAAGGHAGGAGCRNVLRFVGG